MTNKPKLPDPYRGSKLMFCDILGDPELVFAWWPVRCFDRSWVWLRPVYRRLCILKPHLQGIGPGDPWWQYAKPLAEQETQ